MKVHVPVHDCNSKFCVLVLAALGRGQKVGEEVEDERGEGILTETVLTWRCLAPAAGWGCSSVGRASDRHTVDASSFSWCDELLFS